ncbi:ATP-binding protein [Methylocystis sp. 9N]|uniref:Oxygen sensor histidine kinase NreB n=1 Tax=Methylocystis borbori TaxID=3118750 RepID=A0ABU7XKC2_9HYPH
MFRRLSLRMRLSLLLGAVLALGLALGVGLLVLHAGARVRAEADGATRLARDLVEATLKRLETAPDPQAEIGRLLADARRLRHVAVTLEGEEATPQSQDNRAPRWFSALTLPKAAVTRIETPRGAIDIAVNPADEIAEIWQEIVGLAIGGAAIALAAFALVSFAVSRTLEPVATLAEGLRRLERGDHSIRAPGGGSPEFVVIAERINALAATLQRLDDENHRLVQRMIHVQDEERRDIARDLHDEIGPFLFTVRAGVGALARKAASPGVDPARLAEDCARIDAQLAALQEVNRRILGRLRPAALEEMGLADALEALAQGWRETNPRVAISLSLDGAAGEVKEETALTAYRIVQEGLANAFRHSDADRVEVVAERVKDVLRIDVRDNGKGLGFPPAAIPEGGGGLGLRGMSERVSALGGTLMLANETGGGARLTASLPIAPRRAQD